MAERLAIVFTQGQGVWSNTRVDCERDFCSPSLEKADGFGAVAALGELSIVFLTVGVSHDMILKTG